MDVLYQDNRIFVCLKPFGILSTDEKGGLPELIRQELGDDQACVRTVHRLDQVVGGVMVLARSRESARRLGMQVQSRSFKKEYLAVVHGQPEQPSGTLQDLLLRSNEQRRTYIVTESSKESQMAILHYTVLGCKDGLSLVKIQLETGRTHQIRAQFSGHGHPLVGDKKYGAPPHDMDGIALWSHSIQFIHPQTEQSLSFRAAPPAQWPWSIFTEHLT